jgi:hypothetical protein
VIVACVRGYILAVSTCNLKQSDTVRVRRGRLGAALEEERREERKRCIVVTRTLDHQITASIAESRLAMREWEAQAEEAWR